MDLNIIIYLFYIYFLINLFFYLDYYERKFNKSKCILNMADF